VVLATAALAACLPLLVVSFAGAGSRFLAERWPSAEIRALREGRIAELLRLHAEAGRRDEAVSLIEASLPGAAYAGLREELARAVAGYYALRDGAPIARRAGVPLAVVERVRRNLDLTGEALWASAERVMAAAAQEVDAPRLAEARLRELGKLQRLSSAIGEAREGLAELTLAAPGSAADLAEAESQLRLLGEAAKDLATQW